MTSYKQLIGGEWCDASNGGTKSVLNPATEERVREVPYGGGAALCLLTLVAGGLTRAGSPAYSEGA